MKTYKVISLSVGGKNGKIFHSGDIVNDCNFPEGNADKLVKSGHLEIYETGDISDISDAVNSFNPVIESTEAIKEELSESINKQAGELVPEKKIEDYTRKELIRETKDKPGFDSSMSKMELFQLFTGK